MDWEQHWQQVVRERASLAGTHADPGYWDRRAPSFARSTRTRTDEFLSVIEPYLSPRKTLIDAGAGTGRHAIPLSDRLEWVTAVEPSEGMRAQITPKDNITIVASTWEDAEVAPADLVICCHVLYGIENPMPFIAKLERSARERVFIMLRESDLPHPAGTGGGHGFPGRGRLGSGTAARTRGPQPAGPAPHVVRVVWPARRPAAFR